MTGDLGGGSRAYPSSDEGRDRTCGTCKRNPAEGWAVNNGTFHCHGDFELPERLTCFERAMRESGAKPTADASSATAASGDLGGAA